MGIPRWVVPALGGPRKPLQDDIQQFDLRLGVCNLLTPEPSLWDWRIRDVLDRVISSVVYGYSPRDFYLTLDIPFRYYRMFLLEVGAGAKPFWRWPIRMEPPRFPLGGSYQPRWVSEVLIQYNDRGLWILTVARRR